MSTTRRRVLALLLAVAAALPAAAAAAAAPPVTLDLGRFTLTQDGQPARVEDFAFDRYGDSLVVRAASSPWREKAEDLHFDKFMLLVADAREFELISYSSQFGTRADTLRRGITLARSDTAFTLWREHNGRGTGDVQVRPPGRLYVLDAPLFTLFGYIGWTMQGRTFDRRPLNIVVLGARDTLVEGTVTDAGSETLTWNGQTVEARKLLIGDQQTTVEAWFTSDGHMLRLLQERTGIRAERDAPAAAGPPARREEPPPGTK
jgi:hypothetical protein